jgi:hypothetical protein
MGHWSGVRGFAWAVISLDHPLDGTTYQPKQRRIDYAIEYHQTSAYVHASFAAVDGMVPDVGSVYRPRRKSEGNDQQGQKALHTIVQFVHHAVRYLMFGLEVEKTQAIDDLYRDTIAQIEPKKPRYKPDTTYRRSFY